MDSKVLPDIFDLLNNTNQQSNTKMGNLKTLNQPEVRATFLVRADLVEKMKGIAFWDRTLQKDEINNALEKYVKSYEKKFGVIQPIPAKQHSKAA